MSFAIQTKGVSSSTKVFRYKSPWTGEITEFHPERGMVTITGCHVKTGKEVYSRVTRRDFLNRAMALSHEIKVSQYAEEKLALQRLVEVMVAAAAAAKDQGDPTDARVGRELLRDRHRPVAMGGHGGVNHYRYDPGVPPMPNVPAGKPETPLCAPDGAMGKIIIATR